MEKVMTGQNWNDLQQELLIQGIITKDKPVIKTDYAGIQQCQILGNLPFYCNNKTLHLDKPDYITNYKGNGCCLTHRVGLPRHPATGEEMTLTPYQVEFCNSIIQNILGERCDTTTPLIKLSKEELRKSHKFHINKGRQMGFTEIVLRLIQYFCFNRYAGYNVGIMAATNGALAKKNLRRFALLFKHIQNTIHGWERGVVLRIKNECVVEAFKASEEAMTGDTKYKCVFEDENAKWKLIDDTPVFNSIMPIVNLNGADLFCVSTPKGPLKMFYKIHVDPKDFVKLRYDIWRTEGNLYTKDQIQYMLDNSIEDKNQEYLLEFSIGEGSIFGRVTKDDRSDMTEIILDRPLDEDEIDPQEDDSYIETEELIFNPDS